MRRKAPRWGYRRRLRAQIPRGHPDAHYYRHPAVGSVRLGGAGRVNTPNDALVGWGLGARKQAMHRLAGQAKVFPRLELVRRRAQQISRMVSNDHGYALVGMHAAAQADDVRIGTQKGLRSETPHRENKLWPDQRKLT